MRTHLQIISDAGGYRSFASTISEPPERVRFWERRKSIPPEQWLAVSEAGLATLDELAAAAATRRQSHSDQSPSHTRDAAA